MILLICVLMFGAAVRSSANTPVLSGIELHAGPRGLVLILGADAPFSLQHTPSSKRSKTHPSLVLTLSGVIYGLDEYSYESFPAGFPVTKIEAVDKPDSRVVELSLRLSGSLDTIETRKRDNRWLVLLTRKPQNELTWSVSPGTPRSARADTVQSTPVQNSSGGPERKNPSSPAGESRLVDIHIIQRDQVDELTLMFDAPVTPATKRDGDMLIMALSGTTTPLSPVGLPSGSVFTTVEWSGTERVGVRWLTISVGMEKEHAGRAVLNHAGNRINLSVPRAGKPAFAEWSASGGLPPQEHERLVMSDIARQVREDENRNINADQTFSPRSSSQTVATSPRKQDPVPQVVAPASAQTPPISGKADTARRTESAPVKPKSNEPIPAPLPEEKPPSRSIAPQQEVGKKSGSGRTTDEIAGSGGVTVQNPEVPSPKGDTIKPVRYRLLGRDPFVPLKADQLAGQGLADVEKSVIVGILHGPNEKVVVLENPANPGRSFSLRERDAVKNGRLLRIEGDKAIFLLTEFGISRTVTLKMKKLQTSDMIPASTGPRSGSAGRIELSPPDEGEGL